MYSPDELFKMSMDAHQHGDTSLAIMIAALAACRSTSPEAELELNRLLDMYRAWLTEKADEAPHKGGAHEPTIEHNPVFSL